MLALYPKGQQEVRKCAPKQRKSYESTTKLKYETKLNLKILQFTCP